MAACRFARPPRAGSFAVPALGLALAMLPGACTLAPPETTEERARLAAAGEWYDRPHEERGLPEIPAQPTWQDVLHQAFLANGELEAAYHEWNAALERVAIASGYPNSNLALGYSYTFSSERMKTFDRMTFSAGFDAMENLSFPSKVIEAGKAALQDAQAARERFHAMKFSLQQRVLSAWAEYAFAAERVRIAQVNLLLARQVLDTASARVQAGGMQEDLLRAEVAYRMAEDAVRNAEAEQEEWRATLNGMLARDASATLEAPARLPAPRTMPEDDAALIVAGVAANPELAALAHQVAGRANALELARLQWIPDLNPSVVFSGSVAQAVGAVLILPTTIAEIRGAIREGQADLRAAEATLRQTERDRAAAFVAALISLRNSERQATLFEQRILPAAERLLVNLRQSYASGAMPYLDLIDGERTLLEIRLTIAAARTRRETRLAELEALAGVDVETLLVPHNGPALPPRSGTVPTTPRHGYPVP